MTTATSKITDPHEMYAALKPKLQNVVPDVELRYKADLAAQVNQLKIERNAVIHIWNNILELWL